MAEHWVDMELSELFEIRSGDTHAVSELEPGTIPLVSCGEAMNGIVGFYDISPENRYRWAVTAGYAGQPLNAKFHPYEFGAKDDVGLLLPLTELLDTTLLFVAAMLNRMRWRYSFGRKCYWEKMSRLRIPLPMTRVGQDYEIDEDYIESAFERTDLWRFVRSRAQANIDPSVKAVLSHWTMFGNYGKSPRR